MNIMQITQTIHLVPPAQLRRPRRSAHQPTLPGWEVDLQEPVIVTNRQVAEVLAGIADMLEAQNGNPYRIQAYRNGARGVLELSEPAADIIARGEELPIDGMGPRLRAHIVELVQLGSVTIQNGYCIQALPVGVRSLMALPGIGPQTAIRLYQELQIDSVEKLYQAALQQRIRKLFGFGPRSEAKLQMVAENVLRQSTQQQMSQKPIVHGGAA